MPICYIYWTDADMGLGKKILCITSEMTNLKGMKLQLFVKANSWIGFRKFKYSISTLANLYIRAIVCFQYFKIYVVCKTDQNCFGTTEKQ